MLLLGFPGVTLALLGTDSGPKVHFYLAVNKMYVQYLDRPLSSAVPCS